MTLEILILLLVFIGIIVFVLVGIDLFSKGWQSYEERYVDGAEKTLTSMYVTMPPQNILYMGLALMCLVGTIITLISGTIFAGAAGGVLFFFVPQIVIVMMKRKRDFVFGTQLVDALSTMGNALKAGLSLPQAIELIHQEMTNPIRQEFRLLTQEMKFGLRIEQGLVNLQNRMSKNPDLGLMTTAISVSQEVGGNLSEIFDNISNTIRERHRVEQRINALTAQGKMQGMIVSLVPVVLGGVINFLYPEMMEPLYTTGIGITVLVIAAALLAMGAFVISKIVNIDI